MTLDEYLTYRKRVRDLDPDALLNSGSKTPPTDATDFALRVCYVIVNSGMKWTVAKEIWERMKPSLVETGTVGDTFGHPGKRKSIEQVIADRDVHFASLNDAWEKSRDDVIEFCGTLPHIGGVTKFHLAKNLGVDVAKPDVWLERVAAESGEDVQTMCERLSVESKDRVATVDYVVWKTCQQGWWNPVALLGDEPPTETPQSDAD